MNIQPNTELKYTDGNRKYTVKFQNAISDESDDDGYIGFQVYWRQSSKSGYSGSGLVHPVTIDCRPFKHDGDMTEYIVKALAAN